MLHHECVTDESAQELADVMLRALTALGLIKANGEAHFGYSLHGAERPRIEITDEMVERGWAKACKHDYTSLTLPVFRAALEAALNG